MGPRNGTKVGQILNFCQIEGRMWLLPVFLGVGQLLAEKSRTRVNKNYYFVNIIWLHWHSVPLVCIDCHQLAFKIICIRFWLLVFAYNYWHLFAIIVLCLQLWAFVGNYWHLFENMGICFQLLAFVYNYWYLFAIIGICFQSLAFLCNNWHLFTIIGICLQLLEFVCNYWHSFAIICISLQ